MINEELGVLFERASEDESLRRRLLGTKNADDPVLALCEMATELGCPVTVGEIFENGEGYLSELHKGCIGATEPRADWGDMYGLFMASLEGLED